MMKRSWIPRKSPMARHCRPMVRSVMVAHPYHSIDTRAGLKAELHRVTSLIVRKRDGCCVQCGKRDGLQAGHLYSRRYVAIRWDLMNVHGQCPAHNLAHNDNPMPFFTYFTDTYGFDELERLSKARWSTVKSSDDDLRTLLESYRALLRTMEKAA